MTPPPGGTPAGVAERVPPGRLRTWAAEPVDVALPIAVVLLLATIDWAWTIRLGGRSLALPAPQLGVLVVSAGAVALVVLRGRLVWDWLVVAYVALAAWPLVQSRLLGVEAAGGTGIFVTAGLLLLALSQYDVPRPPRRTVAVLATFGAVLAVWMAVLWFAAVDDPGQFYDLKRSVSLPIGPGNFVAAVLLVPILLVLGVPTQRRWRLPALVVLAVGFVVTLSRAGWLVLLGVLSLRWWLRRRDAGDAPRWAPWQWAALGAALVAVLAAYLLTGSSPGDRLDTLLRPAVGARLTIWEAAWHGFLADPVAGFGLDGFTPLAAAAGRFETHPHSMLLVGFGMLGVVGGVMYVGVWLVALRRTLRGPHRMTVGLATLAIALHAQVGAWSLYLVFELLMVMLVVVGTRRDGPDAARGPTEVSLPWRGAVTVHE